ncbi:hypothetical protein PENSPDRAFT_608211 [Peniophora sp. CONT]|nr:hypothetical protein PENSPDRAFT_608211 [Peniophora sp. CONT]
MDPFEVRMQFNGLLRKLDATQRSIQKAVGFALKFYAQCGEDLWDCIVDECQKGSINNRINILYFLDSLCESSVLAKNSTHPHQLGSGSAPPYYLEYVSRDLRKVVGYVVPEGRTGLPNLLSTRQMLDDWRSKRVIDPQIVDEALTTLDSRQAPLEGTDAPSSPLVEAPPSRRSSTSKSDALPRNEIFKRMEEDRERHKRLRERRWVQPTNPAPALHAGQLVSFLPLTDGQLPIDIEFDNEWETTSDWNEDDDDAVAEENGLCFPAEGEEAMDLS